MQHSRRLPWPANSNALALAHERLLRAGMKIRDLSDSNPWRTGLSAWWLGADGQGHGFMEGPEALGYDPDPRGLRTTRLAVRDLYASRGRNVSADSVVLCASTSEAYGWLFKLLCDPGDAVLVPRPGYPLFDHLASLESVRCIGYRQDYEEPGGWYLDLDSLGHALASDADRHVRAIVAINPNNPTGSYLRSSERSALLALVERYGLALICDEVFFEYPLETPGDRESLAGEESVPVFVLDGLSKQAGLPGLKLGWIVASGPAASLGGTLERLDLVADTYLSAGTPVMRAFPGIAGRIPGFLACAGSRLRTNLCALRAGLEGPGSPHRVLRCDGGWTAIVRSPRLDTEERLALGLLEHAGLRIQPGYLYDMEREACFAFSLILEPHCLEAGIRGFSGYFDMLMGAR